MHEEVWQLQCQPLDATEHDNHSVHNAHFLYLPVCPCGNLPALLLLSSGYLDWRSHVRDNGRAVHPAISVRGYQEELCVE